MPLTVIDLDNDGVAAIHVEPAVAGEAARYFAASLAALALDAGLLWLGVAQFDRAPWLVGAFSYVAGLIVVYLLSVHWVFAQRAVPDRRREFLIFAALGSLGLVLNSLTLFAATAVGVALPFAKAIAAGIGFVANFVSRKVLLFSTGKP